jgi:HEAT repeat protein
MQAFNRKIEDILEEVKSPDFGVRRLAIRDLIVSDYQRNVEVLTDLLTIENDIQLRYEIRKGLNELQSLRKSQAAPSTDAPKPQQDFKNLSRAFESDDREVLKKAFLYAVKHKLEDFLPEMLMIEHYLGDSFFKICNIRMFLLSPARSFKYIISYLHDRDARVISTGIEALEQIGNSAALASVAEFTSHENNRVRATAIKALQNLGEERAYMLFTKMIQSPHAAYRDSAAYSLAAMGLHESVQLLSLLLLDEVESVRAKALQGLELLAENGNSKAAAIIDRLKNEYPYGLWPNKLYERFSGAGTSVAVSQTGAVGEAPMAALYSDIPDMRIAAVSRVADEFSGEGASVIMERLRLETEPRVLQAALLALGRADGQFEQKRDVLQSYLSHPLAEIRSCTIKAMAMFLSGYEMAPVATCLKDQNYAVAGNAISALYQNPMYREACHKALKRMVLEDNEEAQRVASLCIHELACDELAEEAEILLRSDYESIRSEVEEILGLMPENSALYVVLQEYRQQQDGFTLNP